MTLDVVTGEVVPLTKRMTTTEAGEAATWLRDMMRAVLKEGEDYGTIPGTKRPTLFKAGAEMLVLAAGMRFTQERIDDEQAREHLGITYRCTVYRGDYPQAVCDGYAGYDEHNYSPGKTSWNTIIKMAQKRALVGAALNAVAGSALFIADLDDNQPPADNQRGTTPPPSGRPPLPEPNPVTEGRNRQAFDQGGAPTNPEVPGTAKLEQELNKLAPKDRGAFREWLRAAGLVWPPGTPAALKRMQAEAAKIEAAAAEEKETYEGGNEAPIRRDVGEVGSPND